jgi:hypothetical protein
MEQPRCRFAPTRLIVRKNRREIAERGRLDPPARNHLTMKNSNF